VIGTLAIDGWVVTCDTARRGLGGLEPRPAPSSLYQMYRCAEFRNFCLIFVSYAFAPCSNWQTGSIATSYYSMWHYNNTGAHSRVQVLKT